MKLSKTVCIGVILLGIGGLAGWALHPIIKGDPLVPMPEYGGTSDFGFTAEVIWHPETEMKFNGGNLVMHDTTWKWVFHNRTDAPIQFSIPSQELNLNRSVYSCQFIELPKTMLIDPPVTIAPDEKKVYNVQRGLEWWHKTKSGECGFQIVAKINDTFHILGCAANVRKAPKIEQGGADQPTTAAESKSKGNDRTKPGE